MTEMHRSFRANGYVLPEEHVSTQELSMLRDVCSDLLEGPVDDSGGNRHRIGLGERRRFLAHMHESFPDLEQFIVSGTPAALAVKLIGEKCHLFNEQFVVKGAGSGASFAWHQDSAYVGFDHTPYLSVWIALDDTNVENGCVYLFPRNLDLEDSIEPHEWNEETRELSGYEGPEEGIAINSLAGAMVAFSSLTFHRSGPNTTANARRAYLVQYSSEPIRDPQSGAFKRFAKAATPAQT